MTQCRFLSKAKSRCPSFFFIFVSIGCCAFNFLVQVGHRRGGARGDSFSHSGQSCGLRSRFVFLRAFVQARCDTAATDAGRITTADVATRRGRPAVRLSGRFSAGAPISRDASSLPRIPPYSFTLMDRSNGEPLVFLQPYLHVCTSSKHVRSLR